MFVTTETGYLQMYNTRKLGKKHLCTIVHEIEVDKDSSLGVESIPGYLIVASSSNMYIYNSTYVTSVEPPVMLDRRELVPEGSAGSHGAVVSATVDVYGH